MQGAIFGRGRNTAVGCVVNFVTILVVYFIIHEHILFQEACEQAQTGSAVKEVKRLK